MASGWLWLNLALILILAALIRRAILASERTMCSPGPVDHGQCDRPSDRSASGWVRILARRLATVSCWPGSATLPGALLRVHFPQGVPFACDGQTGYLYEASLISPRPVLWGPHVVGMGV